MEPCAEIREAAMDMTMGYTYCDGQNAAQRLILLGA